jgi:Predicted hydrolases or acyltransferases (alpha/beta hydrolase superfamily)
MAALKSMAIFCIGIGYFIYYLGWRWFYLRVVVRNKTARGKVHTKAYLALDATTQLYYEVIDICQGPENNKETLVLLHGGLTSITAWFSQLPFLARRYRVVCLDLRGQGRSTLGDLPFSYRLFSTDVFRLMDQLQIQRFHIAGWSDGGNTGLIAALDHPERIKSLVTVGSNYHYSGLKKTVKKDISTVETFSHPIMARLLYSIESSHPARWPELVKRTLALWRDYPRLNESDLQKVETPTLNVMGEYDMVSRAHAENMSEYLPMGKLKIISGRGHSLLFTEPKLISKMISDFILENN